MKKLSVIITVCIMSNIFSGGVYASESNLIDINFGEKLTLQETEGYAEFTGETMLDNFYQAKNELPDEVPVLKSFEVSGENVFYVAANADDMGDGSIEAPFSSVSQALQSIAKLSDVQRAGGSVIYLRGGVYSADERISIGASNTSEQSTLFISAYPGEQVVFNGQKSIPVSCAVKVTEHNINAVDYGRINDDVKDKLYYIDYDALGFDSSIPYDTVFYIGNTPLNIARYPNQGTDTVDSVIKDGSYIDGEGFTKTGLPMEWKPQDQKPFSWSDNGNIHIIGRIANEWSIKDGKVTIDKVSKTIKASDGVLTPNNSPVTTNFWGSIPSTYYYANIFEELDIPGEWYADDIKRRLYFCPITAESKDDDVIGYSYDTGYVFEVNGAQNVVFNDINITYSEKGIDIRDSKKVVVQNSVISNTKSTGINMYNTEKCGLLNSTVGDVKKSTAVVISQSAERGSELLPRRNFVQNSCIYNAEKAMSLGGVTSGNIISHNLFENIKYSCVFLYGAENIFEYNEFSSVVNKITDGGAIYVGGNISNRANTIRYNYMHDSNPNKKNARAIYNDDCSDMSWNYGNIIKNFSYGLFQHSGDDHVIMDNTVINATTYIRNSADYSAQRKTMLSYFFKNSPGYITSYTEYNLGQSNTWQTRYKGILKEKYDAVLEAKEAYWRDEDMFDKVQQVLKKKTSASDYENAADVQKVCDLVADTGCYYIGNTLVTPGSYSWGYGPSDYGLYNTVEPENGGKPNVINLSCEAEANAYDVSALTAGMGLIDDKVRQSTKPVIYMENGTQIQNDKFTGISWNNASNVSHYIIDIATDNEFNNTVISYSTVANEYPVYTYKYDKTSDTNVRSLTNEYEFLNDTMYYVRVTAVSLASCVSNGTSVSDTVEFMLREKIEYADKQNTIELLYNPYLNVLTAKGTVASYLIDETDRQATLILYDNTAQNFDLSAVRGIRQVSADEYGNYSYRFALNDEKIEGLSLRAQIGDGELRDISLSENVIICNEETYVKMYYGINSGNVKVSGKMPDYLLADEDRQVTIILYSADESLDSLSAIRYIHQVNAEADGSFSHMFKIDDTDNLRIRVRAGTSELTDDLFSSTVTTISEVSFNISDGDVVAGDIITAFVNINNLLDITNNFTVAVAAYDKNNRFLSCETTISAAGHGASVNVSKAYKVPDGTKYLKAYLWNTAEIKPLIDAIVKE